MIHIVIELSDVDFQAVPGTDPILYQSPVYILHTFVGTTPFDASVCVRYEYVVPVRSQHIDDTVMYHPVWKERSYHYIPLLRIKDLFSPIYSRLKGFLTQDLIQGSQAIIQIVIERLYLTSILFALLGCVLRLDQVFGTIYQWIYILDLLYRRNIDLSCVSDIVAYILKITVHYRDVVLVGINFGFLLFLHLCAVAQSGAFNYLLTPY